MQNVAVEEDYVACLGGNEDLIVFIGHAREVVQRIFDVGNAFDVLDVGDQLIAKAIGYLRAGGVNRLDAGPFGEPHGAVELIAVVDGDPCAAKGVGMTTLLERIDQMLAEDPLSRVWLRVPQKEGKMLALLEARSRIYSRHYKDGLVELEAEAPESVVRRVREWVVPDFKPTEIRGETLSETIRRERR